MNPRRKPNIMQLFLRDDTIDRNVSGNSMERAECVQALKRNIRCKSSRRNMRRDACKQLGA